MMGQVGVTDRKSPENMESQVFVRSAVASFAGHMVLAAGLVLAEVHPFDYVPPESIAVDIVSPAEAPPPAKETSPEPPQKPQADAFDIPDDKPPVETKAAAAPAQRAQPEAQPAQPPPSPTQAPDVATPPVSQQAALQPQPEPQPASPPSYKAPEPDISVKYGVLLGLPPLEGGEGAGAAETTKADISAMDTAEFRRHLKSCSKMPASVSPGDKIRIVLRVPFTTDGKVAAPPALIEASASAKGPALMKGAIEALVACQPYTMLPADKYKEWKVLDLSFTPSDFVGG
jgi:hypothetical protein